VAILSNSIGSCDDVGWDEAKIVEEKLQIPVIRHQRKKPGCLQEVSISVRLIAYSSRY
jgi:phosphatidylglycerophosphatase GEP4